LTTICGLCERTVYVDKTHVFKYVRGFLTGAKRQGPEANHSRPSSDETENSRTCSSIPHNIPILGA